MCATCGTNEEKLPQRLGFLT